MTKKSKSNKQNDKEHRPFRFQSLHERLNNININVVHRIRYHDTIDIRDDQDLIQQSHFHNSLEHWSTLNFSEAYSVLYTKLIPLSGSLEQIVYNREQIISFIRQTLNQQDPLVIETLLDLIVQLARDLQNDFYIYYKQYLFVDIINLLKSSNQKKQTEINTQLLEQVFQCLTYLFKYLWRIMLKDLGNLYELYSKYLFSSVLTNTVTTHYEYIRSFAAESFAYLLRKIENYQGFIDYLFDKDAHDESEYESLALVFSETCQNVQSTFHSCTKSLLTCLLAKLLVKPQPIDLCIKTIYSLLIKHTNKQNISILWNCFIEIYRKIDHNQNHDYVIYKTFYEIFQLFIENKMIIDSNSCYEFLTKMIIKDNNEQYLMLHYETVFKLMNEIMMNKQLIDIYFRFYEQTTLNILYQQTRKIFQTNLNDKLPNEFHNYLWKQILNETNNKQDVINCFVDYIIQQRTYFNMIFHPNDDNEKIVEKKQLLNTKKNFLIKEKINENSLKFIQNFIQDTLTKIDDVEYLSTGRVWRSLILLNSLSAKDSNSFRITNLQIEQLSNTLIQNSLCSTTIALTLLELVCHDHVLSTSLWYSILKDQYQSEIHLMCTRVAFQLNTPSQDELDKFLNLLKRNLSSFYTNIRLLTLHTLCSFVLNENHVLYSCLSCEQCPLNVYEYRSKIIFIQKLSVDFVKLNNQTSSFHLAMYYLLGLLSSNFTPLWSIVMEILGSYGTKAIEYITHSYFWSILDEKFQSIKDNEQVQYNENIDDNMINEYITQNNRSDTFTSEINEKSLDYMQYRINLFEILSHFPNECEQRTKVLLPIIYDFFSNEYYDHILSIGLTSKNQSSYTIQQTSKNRLSSKLSIKTLEKMLNLLKQFHHHHQWFQPTRLYDFYTRLLLSSDNSIQQLAYQCLLNCYQMPESIIQKDFLQYSETILPLFNPSTCRKTFHDLIQGVLIDKNVNDSIKSQYAFLLIRILFSKLNEKRSLGSTTRGRKNYLELNRKYLFQFLITFASNDLYEEHVVYFIQLMLEPFYDELFSSNDSNLWFILFKQKISFHPNHDLQSYELFIKYLQHSLLSLKTFLSKLGVYIQKHINYVIKFYILAIKFVNHLMKDKYSNDDNIQIKTIRTLLKRIRSISFKGLQIIFQLFDNDNHDIFDNDLIKHVWICCVRESYLDDFYTLNKQREDIVHVLKLSTIWTSTLNLKQIFFSEDNSPDDLIKYFIKLLNDNITYDNKQLIIEVIWNIIQIDPDDQLIVPYYDTLLDYLTRVSSSMIESNNNIALTDKEFDILLILSRKETKQEKINQLCSIFIRLIRQNVLSKKKKKFSTKITQENFNVSIIKILQNLILNIDNPIEKYLHLLSNLCYKINQRDQRIEFIQLYNKFIEKSNNISSDLSWYLKQLVELNSWNSEQVDEPDYERRLNSYKQITERIQTINYEEKDTHIYLSLFYHFLYELNHSVNDLSLREYSSQSIRLFLKKIPSYQTYILTEIRGLLKQTTISIDIRHEFIRLLSSIIDINETNEDLNDLKRLRNTIDVEIDFFSNITHVQHHRRLRALKRLKLIHEEQAFRVSTIYNYILPIVCSFVHDVINEHTEDIHDDIVFTCLTMLCRNLTWGKYNELFISFFRQLKTTKRSLSLIQKRCLTKTISAIIDAFHFKLNNDENNSENRKIRQTIQNRLLPMILDLLSQNSFSVDSLTPNGTLTATKNQTIDDQRQQAVLLTVTCSLIATKLIVIFPNDFIEQHISTIILHIITLLRSRLYSIRDQARDCLCKCITIFGKRYFKFIIEELIAGLQRGYQHFVLLHTINTILIHISSLTYEFNIDATVKTITKLYVDDFFNLEKTESSKASEHENSTYKPSNIPEAKTNKTANVMELLGRLIYSHDVLLTCIEPLQEQLISNNDSIQISKCEKCLQRFQTGLINNANISNEILFIFIHHLLTKTEQTDINPSTKNEPTKSIVDEREKYHLIPSEPKRGHARVSQSIKNVKKTNLHCLISWTLNLLHKLIKKCKNTDQTFLSMVDPFVSHIEISLNSPYTDVVVSALRNLSSLLEYSLPSLNKESITNIYRKVFDLLKLYSSVAGSTDMNDLLTLCYKILGTFVQRSTNDNVSLTSDEYQCLFAYIETDLLNTHRQSSAFLLLRSMMRHSAKIISNDKTLRTQLDNLLRSRIMFMIVQSNYDHIRSTCRELFHIYLFSYEHTKSKLKSYLDFFLLQLDYDDWNGRLSASMFLHSFFNDVTKQRLNDFAAYFFVPLSCHYYNETNSECKKYLQSNLRLLLEKIDEKHRNDILKNIVLSWLDDKIEHRCLAIQLMIHFIEIEREQFDQYLSNIFDFIEKELNNIENNEMNNDDEEKDNEENHNQEKFYDQYIYHLINVLINVIKCCPNSLSMLQLRSKWLKLLKLIDEKCLLHPHLWIRFLSSQFFALLFEIIQPENVVQILENLMTQHDHNSSTTENGPTRKRIKKTNDFNPDQQSLFIHYLMTYDSSKSPFIKIQRLCLCSCSQLKPSGLTEEFCLQILKNLIYLSKVLILSKSNHLDLVVRRCFRLTTFESTKHPNEITRRSSILKWMAAIIIDLSSYLTSHIKTFLTVIEREIERNETAINLPLKTLAQEVFDVFKRQCDLHLITTVYADVAKERRTKRLERKQKLAVLAINQPEIIYRKKRAKQTKRLGLGKKKRLKAIENAKKNRKKKSLKQTSEDIDDF